MNENVSKLSTFSHSRENVCRLGQSLPYKAIDNVSLLFCVLLWTHPFSIT